MADTDEFDADLWHAFLARHVLSLDEQDAFLEYLTEQPELVMDSMATLDRVYMAFLRRDLPPTAS
jgi:hypothetical protein